MLICPVFIFDAKVSSAEEGIQSSKCKYYPCVLPDRSRRAAKRPLTRHLKVHNFTWCSAVVPKALIKNGGAFAHTSKKCADPNVADQGTIYQQTLFPTLCSSGSNASSSVQFCQQMFQFTLPICAAQGSPCLLRSAGVKCCSASTCQQFQAMMRRRLEARLISRCLDVGSQLRMAVHIQPHDFPVAVSELLRVESCADLHTTEEDCSTCHPIGTHQL